jgi:hypothetical protein
VDSETQKEVSFCDVEVWSKWRKPAPNSSKKDAESEGRRQVKQGPLDRRARAKPTRR